VTHPRTQVASGARIAEPIGPRFSDSPEPKPRDVIEVSNAARAARVAVRAERAARDDGRVERSERREELRL